MATQNTVSSGNRPNDAFKPEVDEGKGPELAEETIMGTNITDLDDDCLEQIFKNLGPKDLLNVAVSSDCFKEAANLAYASKYRQMKVIINREKDEANEVDLDNGYIFVYGLLSSLRLVRYFGHSMSSLKILFVHDKRWVKLGEYVSKYCAEALTEIDLNFAQTKVMKQFTKLFPKVTIVQLFRCELNSSLFDVSKWFPQVQSLEIRYCRTGTNRKSIEKHFPNLQFLVITGVNKESKRISWHRSNIAEVVRLNSQLRSLKIAGDLMNAAFIREISEHLQKIEDLNIWCLRFFGQTNENDIIHFKNAKKLTFNNRILPAQQIQQ